MRKYIFLVVLTLVLFTSHFVRAETWRFEWENSYVSIPIYDSINSYDDVPRAKLYRNNEYLNDASITYDRNGDWLYYYKDVDTTVPGDYKVWYKANETKYRPGNCANYKQLITFHVYDDISPTITILKKEINLPLNSKDVTYDSYFSVRDNLPDVKVTVDDSNVNYKEEGEYEVKITAIDTSGNKKEDKLKVKIEDGEGPVITFLGKDGIIEVERGSVDDEKEFFMSYFKASDSIDGNVSHTIKYSDVNLNIVGETEVSFTFNDYSGNETSETYLVRVVDKLVPIINLKTDHIDVDYKTEPNLEFYRDYIVEAYDGLDNLIEEVKIDYSEIELKVGTYNVYYSLVDKENNETTKILQVNYKTDKAPEIKTTDVKINVGENINFEDYVVINDDSDPNVYDNLSIDTTKFNNKLAGIYYLNVIVHNSSGLYSNSYLKVEVVDTNSNKGLIINSILISCLVLVVIGAVTYYIIKRKKDKALPN